MVEDSYEPVLFNLALPYTLKSRSQGKVNHVLSPVPPPHSLYGTVAERQSTKHTVSTMLDLSAGNNAG